MSKFDLWENMIFDLHLRWKLFDCICISCKYSWVTKLTKLRKIIFLLSYIPLPSESLTEAIQDLTISRD